MLALSRYEKKKILDVLGKNPEMFIYFEQKLQRAGVYVEDFSGHFDKDFFKDFMKNKLKKVLFENKEAIKNKLEEKKLTENDVMNTFQESGSMGITMLIDEMLNKMIGKGPVTQDVIANLIELISVRNQLQRIEMDYLNDEYKVYLKQQILNLES